MRRLRKSDEYVMFGYCLADIDTTAYLAKIPCSHDKIEDVVTAERSEARVFPKKNLDHIEGFGSPEKWLKYVNDEMESLFGKDGYRFHLLKVCK